MEALKQELAVTKARHAIELEDMRKQADRLECEQIRSEGIKREAEIENERAKDSSNKNNR